jgi:hypothetical protein
MHRRHTSPGNAQIVIHPAEGGRIIAATIQDLPIADPAIRQMLRLIIMQDSARIAILPMAGAVLVLTTTGKTTVFPAIQVMLPETIIRGNVRTAIIQDLDGQMPASIIQDLMIVHPATVVMHHPRITLGNVPIAMIRAVDGITHILIILD